MLTPRSRIAATAFLLSTATGLFYGSADIASAQTPAAESSSSSEVMSKIEEEYKKDGRQVPESFAKQAEISRRQQKRDLERERKLREREQAEEAKKAKVSLFQRMTGGGKDKETPVQTVGRRRRYEDYNQYQQQQQQPQQQQQQTPPAQGNANNQQQQQQQQQPDYPLSKKQRKALIRERNRQWIAEQEKLRNQQQQAQAQAAAQGKVQTAQAQPGTGETQEPAVPEVPGPMASDEANRQPLPQTPLPNLPFQTPPAAAPGAYQAPSVSEPQPAATTPASATPVVEAPSASVSAPPTTTAELPATPSPASAKPAASVPLLSEGETEPETHVPAPQASSRPQVSAVPEVIENSKPYDRNKPFTPPTGEAPPVPSPSAAPTLRYAPAVTRKAAADVPLLTSPDAAQPDNRSAEPSPYSGLRLTPEESEHRVARGLGGPAEESSSGLHEAHKAPGVPDLIDSSGATGAEIPGLRGYCLVYLREHRQYVAGQAQFKSQYHSRTYTFSSIDAKREFDKHPERYAPVQDGTDVVAATQGANVGGTLDHAAWFKGRLYLFSSAENMAAFWKAPKTYAR